MALLLLVKVFFKARILLCHVFAFYKWHWKWIPSLLFPSNPKLILQIFVCSPWLSKYPQCIFSYPWNFPSNLIPERLICSANAHKYHRNLLHDDIQVSFKDKFKTMDGNNGFLRSFANRVQHHQCHWRQIW